MAENKKWSRWAIIEFIISLVIIIYTFITSPGLNFFQIPSIFEFAGLGFIGSFMIAGFVLLILNIITLIITKKQNKKGALLSIIGIVLGILTALFPIIALILVGIKGGF